MTLVAADLVYDLDTKLDLGGEINVPRAELLLRLALGRAAAVVSPVPDTALGIILDAAGRSYVNPRETTSEAAGPFNRSFATPGVYLTRRERADLRALAGAGGAFTINPIAPPEEDEDG